MVVVQCLSFSDIVLSKLILRILILHQAEGTFVVSEKTLLLLGKGDRKLVPVMYASESNPKTLRIYFLKARGVLLVDVIQ